VGIEIKPESADGRLNGELLSRELTEWTRLQRKHDSWFSGAFAAKISYQRFCADLRGCLYRAHPRRSTV